RAHAVALERVLGRLGRQAELAAFLSKMAQKAASGVERARMRLALATLYRRRGEAAGALRELVPLLGEPGAYGPGYCLTLLLAAERGDQQARALALCRVAGHLPPSLRAVLLAVAAEELLAAG